jgi:hypothetical protein
VDERSIDNELKKVDKLDRNNLLQYRTDKSYVKSFSFKIGECMGVTNIRTNSTVPTARFIFMFLFKKT